MLKNNCFFDLVSILSMILQFYNAIVLIPRKSTQMFASMENDKK